MTRQQRWAKHAYERVVLRKGNEAKEKKYATLCMKAPSLLQSAGLVQAVAFLRTRDEGQAFVDDLAQGLDGLQDGAALQTRANQAPLAAYMTLSHEVIALASWFRRFAQAELKSEEG